MNIPVVQTSAAACHEEVKAGLAVPLGKKAVPPPCIGRQDPKRRRMERNQARLAELRFPDREQAFIPVDVLMEEVERLADAHAGDGEQAEQAKIGPPSQRVGRRKLLSCAQQPADLLVGVEVGLCRPRATPHQADGWNLAVGVDSVVIAGEAPHDLVTHGSGLGAVGAISRRKLDGQGCRDVAGLATVQKRDELVQPNRVALELEAESASQLHVFGHCPIQGVHWTPPGQDNASGRRAFISTLAYSAVVF